MSCRPHRTCSCTARKAKPSFRSDFVELKHNDAIARKQLLGLALIQDILESPVEIARYVPVGTQVTPKTYRDEWPRRGFIRQ